MRETKILEKLQAFSNVCYKSFQKFCARAKYSESIISLDSCKVHFHFENTFHYQLIELQWRVLIGSGATLTWRFSKAFSKLSASHHKVAQSSQATLTVKFLRCLSSNPCRCNLPHQRQTVFAYCCSHFAQTSKKMCFQCITNKNTVATRTIKRLLERLFQPQITFSKKATLHTTLFS